MVCWNQTMETLDITEKQLPAFRMSMEFTGRNIDRVGDDLYKVRKRTPLTLDDSWCVVYSDVLLDDLCAIQYLSKYYENLYLIVNEEETLAENVYGSERVRTVREVYTAVHRWFSRTIVSRTCVHDIGDDASRADCYLMSSASKIAFDLRSGVTFKSISGMIGDFMPGIEYNESQDEQSYVYLCKYGFNQYTLTFCERCVGYGEYYLEYLGEYIETMRKLKENTCCYDLQMVIAALNKMRGVN